MKKITIIMFSMFLFILWGCTPSKIEEGALKDFILPEFIYDDVSFPTQFVDSDNNTHQLNYSSSDSNILTITGKIGKIDKDEEVTISVTMEFDKKTYQRDYMILVLKGPFEEGVLSDLSIPEIIYEDYTFLYTMNDNLDQKYNLTYYSSNEDVLDNKGQVTRSDKDENIVIKVVADREKHVYIKEYNVLVPSSKTEMSEDIIAALEAKDSFDLGIETIESNINLPISYSGFDLTWVSSNKEVIDDKGNYYPIDQDENITLTVKFEKNDKVLASKDFAVLVKKTSPEDKLVFVHSSIVIPSIIAEDDVIQLDSSFSYGVQGSWESSEPDALSNDGKVVFKTYEQSVVLTLTLSYLDEVKQFDYIITISAIENSFEFLEAVSSINIPLETKNNIYLPSTVNINNEDIILEYNISKPDIISYDGIINRDNNDEEVLIVIKRILENRIEMIEKNIVVLGYAVEAVAELLDLGIEETYVDIELPSSFMGYEILWLSYNEDVISSSGKYSFVSVDTEVTLSALFAAGSYPEKEIKVIAKPIPDSVRLNMIINTIEIPEVVGTNLNLETVYDYSVTGEWTSSDEYVITTDGIVYLTSIEKNVTLSLTLYSGEETLTKLFIVKTIAIEGKQVMGHNYQDYAKDYNLMSMVDVHLEDERLVLDEGKTTGTYVSSEFNTIGFERLVASWAAISSMKGTVEIEIKVKVDGIWSKYFSYQKWGLGLQNKSIDSSDSIAKLSTDEVVILNSKTAVAYQYKVTLRRNASLDESPKLLLVAVALTIPNYTYPVDTTGFPDFVDYDVPLLNQNEVPVIGNSICSITSSTMLLKYKGHNFEEYDSEYEHRYIAGLFKDYGANIYGNWVYNTVGMSAYGEETFVNKMYSFAELQKHLLEVGPISASVKGNMGLYTTAGHLIVVRGYRITNGQTYVITNDPNINSRFGNDLFVYYEYPLATFINVWRGVNYIIK